MDGDTVGLEGGVKESVIAMVVEAIIIVTIIALTHVLLVLDIHEFMNNGTKDNWRGQFLG